jgi:hypothetical protein
MVGDPPPRLPSTIENRLGDRLNQNMAFRPISASAFHSYNGKPLSVEGQVGVNLALGIAALTLVAAP